MKVVALLVILCSTASAQADTPAAAAPETAPVAKQIETPAAAAPETAPVALATQPQTPVGDLTRRGNLRGSTARGSSTGSATAPSDARIAASGYKKDKYGRWYKPYVPPAYKVPGGRPTPTDAKKSIAIWTLPLVFAAFIFVHLSDRKLPKWTGMVGCALGLYGAHISYGVLQEYVMTAAYSGPTAMYGTMAFPSVSFLVCANRVMATLFALIVVKYVQKKPLGLFGGVDAEGSARIACLLPSLTNVAATWFQYASLWYVTFPTQMLFKSLKLVPVLICGKVFMKRATPFRECADAFLITIGVLAFAWFAETDPSAGKFSWTSHSIGMLMLLGFLICDAVTPSLQKRAFSNSNLDAFQMMFWIGAASSVYAFAMLYFSGEMGSTISFLMTRPEAAMDVLALSLIATLGQIFIYVTVQKHGPVALSLIMTTRQVGSVLISCLLFGHQLPSVAIAAASVVFSVLLIRSYRSSMKSDELTKKGKALLGDAAKASGSSQATAEYPTAPSTAGESSQISSAFGLAKGFASKYSSKAAALTGKLRG